MENTVTQFIIFTNDNRRFVGESDYSFNKLVEVVEECMRNNELVHFEELCPISTSTNLPMEQSYSVAFNPSAITSIAMALTEGD